MVKYNVIFIICKFRILIEISRKKIDFSKVKSLDVCVFVVCYVYMWCFESGFVGCVGYN